MRARSLGSSPPAPRGDGKNFRPLKESSVDPDLQIHKIQSSLCNRKSKGIVGGFCLFPIPDKLADNFPIFFVDLWGSEDGGAGVLKKGNEESVYNTNLSLQRKCSVAP